MKYLLKVTRGKGKMLKQYKMFPLLVIYIIMYTEYKYNCEQNLHENADNAIYDVSKVNSKDDSANIQNTLY